MNSQLYIINDINPFTDQSPVKEVQHVFNHLTYSHIPLKKDDHYMGCISETDAACFDTDKTLGHYLHSLEDFFVRDFTNWLDVLEAFAQNNCNIMPVLDKNNKYLGYYELGEVIALFNETPFLNESGGIIVIEKGIFEYSFSEICQIIETNDAKVLGVFISKIENDLVQATIKIGQTGINPIVQTFRRYGYNIVSSHNEDKFLENLKDRSDYLDKYLNI